MSAPQPVAFVGGDLLVRRAYEQPVILAVNRLSMFVLLLLVLAAWGRSPTWVWVMLGWFGLASMLYVWRATSGRGAPSSTLRYYWVTCLFVVAGARGTEGGVLLLVLLTPPLNMCTHVHGLRHGLALALACSLVWLVDADGPAMDAARLLPVLAMFLLVGLSAFIAYPMTAMRQRLQLEHELDQGLDPRRGLVAVGQVVGERLRAATQARRVLLCHREAEVPTVLVCDAEDGAFVASAALGGRVLALLDRLPVASAGLRLRGGLEFARPAAGLQAPEQRLDPAPLRELAQLLEADALQLVPDAPGQARASWLLLVFGADDGDARGRPWPLQTLAGFAADLRRTLQQASYVDRLQEEIGAHERSRIGRDLHDSAIQPYLGLKFAVEGLAMRSEAGNPLHPQIQELRTVCDAELVELRRTVSALRAGDTHGENSLTMALQRQCTRFARLFDIEIELQVQADLTASRNLISALLHMVNEALNNVRRHTPARRVWISLTSQSSALQLQIRDDAGQRSGRAAPAFEPRSLSERARELGGALHMGRHNGLDTEITITLPN